MLDEYGIADMHCDDLPRGVLIGTVELYDCDEGDWNLREPQRLTDPVKPVVQPQPIWFYPFAVLKYAGTEANMAPQSPIHAPTEKKKKALDRPIKPRTRKSMNKYAKNWESIFGKCK